jgi:hypothetical protein
MTLTTFSTFLLTLSLFATYQAPRLGAQRFAEDTSPERARVCAESSRQFQLTPTERAARQLQRCSRSGPGAVIEAWQVAKAPDSASLYALMSAAAMFPDARVANALLRTGEDRGRDLTLRIAAIATLSSYFGRGGWPIVRRIGTQDVMEPGVVLRSHTSQATSSEPLDSTALSALRERLEALDTRESPLPLRRAIEMVRARAMRRGATAR